MSDAVAIVLTRRSNPDQFASIKWTWIFVTPSSEIFKKIKWRQAKLSVSTGGITQLLVYSVFTHHAGREHQIK